MLNNIRDVWRSKTIYAFVNHTEAMIGSSVRHSKPVQTMVHLLDIGSVMFTHYILDISNCPYRLMVLPVTRSRSYCWMFGHYCLYVSPPPCVFQTDGPYSHEVQPQVVLLYVWLLLYVSPPLCVFQTDGPYSHEVQPQVVLLYVWLLLYVSPPLCVFQTDGPYSHEVHPRSYCCMFDYCCMSHPHCVCFRLMVLTLTRSTPGRTAVCLATAVCLTPTVCVFQTDGNASFLRAARAGNLEKVFEYLKGSTDINTSNAVSLAILYSISHQWNVHQTGSYTVNTLYYIIFLLSVTSKRFASGTWFFTFELNARALTNNPGWDPGATGLNRMRRNERVAYSDDVFPNKWRPVVSPGRTNKVFTLSVPMFISTRCSMRETRETALLHVACGKPARRRYCM